MILRVKRLELQGKIDDYVFGRVQEEKLHIVFSKRNVLITIRP